MQNIKHHIAYSSLFRLVRCLLCSVAVMLLVACRSAIDMPDYYANDQHLVINSIITAGDTVKVNVTHSVFFLNYRSDTVIPTVADADVRLTVNNQTERLALDDDCMWFRSTLIPQPGDSVTLWVSDGIDTAICAAKIPQTVSVLIDTTCVSRNFIWTLEYRRDEQGNIIYDSLGNAFRDTTGWDMRLLYKATVGVVDPYPQSDGYIAAARHVNEYADGTMKVGSNYAPAWNTYTYTSASNILLSQLGYSISTTNFTSDNRLNGDTLQFTVNPYFYVNNTSTAQSQQIHHVYLIVDIYHITYDYYRFLESANLSNYSGNTGITSLLGEPAHTYTNVSGGLGIVGSQALTSDTLLLY